MTGNPKQRRTRYSERVAFVCQGWLKEQLEADAFKEDKTVSDLIRERIARPYKGVG